MSFLPKPTTLAAALLGLAALSTPAFAQPAPADTSVLTAWFEANREHPYPDEAQQAVMAEAAHLSVKQVSVWFTNARLRNRAPGLAQAVPAVQLPIAAQGAPGGLPDANGQVLRAWAEAHSDHPYPEEAEGDQLAAASGLSVAQVSNWFINYRIREWQR